MLKDAKKCEKPERMRKMKRNVKEMPEKIYGFQKKW